MLLSLVEISELSGPACKIYSIAYDGNEDTIFDDFLNRTDKQYSAEVEEIWNSLEFMGKEGGARIQFFRENEGRPGDLIVALLKKKKFSLRLYCIRYGTCTLVLGDGGYKAPSVRAWQDDPHLSGCVQELMRISSILSERTKEKDLRFAADGSILGDLDFEIDTE